jgi:hypothetical protein
MKRRLKDIVELRIGYQFRGKVESDPTGPIPVIQIKDIDASLQIRASAMDRVEIEQPEPYQVREGDVLFLARGHRLYAAVVPEVEPGTIATSYFLILRPKDGLVSAEFLAWSMNQPEFQRSLRPFHRGSHMPVITRREVEHLRIHVPPLDVQRRILRLNELLKKERRLTTAIQERQSLLVRAVSRKLLVS